MLAAVFLMIVFAIVFASAEAAYQVVRLARRPPRWRALVVLAGATLCLSGVIHFLHSLL
ncbi:hypothetical protein SAMN05421770_104134 [Granulicella rosea]|uniref:Uncharacterized protein n=1 Tax=Granulicella rosea TaxID=474952 RepID=A0A239JUE4_9BACT|nr:hypothetical protein [Granulicella rosea]SNT09405.1 hypothetical protein SAMN05421770_104134 [Granulicella rosea]